MAAGFVESIIKNHPFIDGNKRAAHLAVGMFLSLNDYFLNMDEASVIEITQGVATGDVNIDKLELCFLLQKSEYLFVSSSELKRKRFKQPMYKEIDDAVGIWMSQFLAANQILRGDILQKKAKQFADRFEFAEFIAFAALFWQLEPSKTLAQGPVTETKKSKN
ncbi:hypothetical protein RhiirA5_384236 [Rhizophagus irregularis]|uniref:Fido domain-containing protein n=1 Tax=Rhizophagus irregularis TaxID=588596 RepID=A0A2N0NU12_9GLOM|nr:hypothetical protein RhiirA5_384236 [Rhizophagus irregularis]